MKLQKDSYPQDQEKYHPKTGRMNDTTKYTDIQMHNRLLFISLGHYIEKLIYLNA